jgi:outer membrane immunogenic protein
VKRILSLSSMSCVLVAACLSSANAADMPLKAPAYAAPTSSWTGFYLGVNGGAGWGTAASSIDLAGLAAGLGVGGLGALGSLPVGSHEINGFLGGGQIGYNWQTGNIVFGLEGDGDWADVEGTAPCIEVLACSAKVNWTADATVRLGVLPMSNVLVYVKGGAAWAGLNYNLSSAGVLGAGASLTSSLTTTKTGGLLGIGTEYLFAPHWTAKIEYNYADFGSHTDTFVLTESTVAGSLSVPVPIQTTLQMHTVKAGVNYHF